MTRKSKPARSCGLCKPHKYWGNSKQRLLPRDRRKLDSAREQLHSPVM